MRPGLCRSGPGRRPALPRRRPPPCLPGVPFRDFSCSRSLKYFFASRVFIKNSRSSWSASMARWGLPSATLPESAGRGGARAHRAAGPGRHSRRSGPRLQKKLSSSNVQGRSRASAAQSAAACAYLRGRRALREEERARELHGVIRSEGCRSTSWRARSVAERRTSTTIISGTLTDDLLVGLYERAGVEEVNQRRSSSSVSATGRPRTGAGRACPRAFFLVRGSVTSPASSIWASRSSSVIASSRSGVILAIGLLRAVQVDQGAAAVPGGVLGVPRLLALIEGPIVVHSPLR